LVGQTLGCWCNDENQCHAKVLQNQIDAYTRSSPPSAPSAPSAPDTLPHLEIRRKSLYSVRKKLVKKIRPLRLRIIRETRETGETRARKEIEETREIEEIRETRETRETREIESFAIGSISLSEFINFPIVQQVHVREDFGEQPLNLKLYTIVAGKGGLKPIITKDCVTHLRSGKYTKENWPSFICKVVRIVKNKKTNRFSMEISDESSSSSIKVELGSQLFPLLEKRFIGKDDIIFVKDYSISVLAHLTENDNDDDESVKKTRKKIILVTRVLKFIGDECHSYPQ